MTYKVCALVVQALAVTMIPNNPYSFQTLESVHHPLNSQVSDVMTALQTYTIHFPTEQTVLVQVPQYGKDKVGQLVNSREVKLTQSGIVLRQSEQILKRNVR